MGKHKPKERKIIYEQIEGIPDEEAQRALDHAYDILFDAMWDKYRTVKIPKRLKNWYGRAVYLLAAPDCAIHICDEPTHERISQAAAATLRASGVEEDKRHTLDGFFLNSATRADITSDGLLLLMGSLLKHAGYKGRWKFESIPTGISVRRSG